MQQLFAIERIMTPVSSPDEAMEAFRMFSTFSPLSCYVTRDGKEMRYRIMRPTSASQFQRRCDEYMRQARLVINVFGLPLHPVLDQFVIGNVVIEATLILKYGSNRD